MTTGFLEFMKDRKPTKLEPSLEDLMKQGVTSMLNGREIILGYTDTQKRIGWVWKDTGLPASKEKNT
jgi:hypothetical protein